MGGGLVEKLCTRVNSWQMKDRRWSHFTIKLIFVSSHSLLPLSVAILLSLQICTLLGLLKSNLLGLGIKNYYVRVGKTSCKTGPFAKTS